MNGLKHLTFLFLVVSCASLSEKGKKVRLTRHGESVKGCTFIEQVEVSTALSGTGQIAANDSLRIQIRNSAADLGGNVVLLQEQMKTYAGNKMYGDVYRCQKRRMKKRKK